MTSITRQQGAGLGRSRGRGPAAGDWSMATVGEWLRSPVAPYYMVLSSAGILISLGLVMVLSASGPRSFVDNGSSYTVFLEQLAFAGVGVVLAIVGSRLPVRAWKALALPAILLALALQAAVFSGLGIEFQGNRNWISIAGYSLQPSEFGKLALVVYGAAVLANRRKVIHRIGQATIPFVLPFGAVLVGLVLAGHDLGTAMIMVALIVGMLWTAGLPAKWFVGVGAVAAGGVAFLAAGSANRMQRIQVWLGDICDSPHAANGGCFQKVHAEYALADGGWWGLGLGASREKWGLLPEPHNDFILAIIGEELGLPGTLAVLLLFAILAYACFRIVSQSDDPFVRLATAGVMIWILSQALLNIGSVIGMLPIIGVPLPLVSSGGSALIAAMIGIGLLLALARAVPGAQERLGARPSRLRRTFSAVPTRRTAKGRR
ncbi:putative lipid II flippase FtsW [Ornithinimicrobium humiphilum]|uniref:Probable peptidoglycan glycosyltransferase FtsW n=1 Tax=Ornithinimicrobium humiphilum TaxID=125288 RepID=A0A543KMW4_9MICO|nr:putative lipid II flippase FtsW [Ornithinimicrobium humiphilum]TQM96415.1 cell division-specific peptidoglycan biosynthesis regulator FtsW [Ornithinimicrobium humiphilum]